MNQIELISFTIVFALAIALLAYYTPLMKESVSLWITWKSNEVKISRHFVSSPLRSKSDLRKDRIWKEAVVKEQLEEIRQQVTKYFLFALCGLIIFCVSIYWLINFSTLWQLIQWKSLFQSL